MTRQQIAGILLSGIPIYNGDIAECFSEAQQQLDLDDLSDQDYIDNTLSRLGIIKTTVAAPRKTLLN